MSTMDIFQMTRIYPFFLRLFLLGLILNTTLVEHERPKLLLLSISVRFLNFLSPPKIFDLLLSLT